MRFKTTVLVLLLGLLYFYLNKIKMQY